MGLGGPEGDSARARTFVALALGPELAARLAAQVAPVLEGAEFRPTRAAGLHLTLAFLGEVARTRLEPLARALRAAVAGTPGPSLRLRGTGAFPGAARARVLWVGVEEEAHPGRLAACRRRVLQALREAGLPAEREEREPFHPHVTVARARTTGPRRSGSARSGAGGTRSVRGLPPAFDALGLDLAWHPREVELLESRIAEGGRRYVALERVAFAPAD